MGRIKKDIHTHTIFSRGVGRYGHHAVSTMEENCKSAFQKGLSTIGISDHGPGHKLYGMNKYDYARIIEEKNRLKDYYSNKGLEVLLGIEANLTGWNGEIDVPKELEGELDYILMGYHYAAMPYDSKSGVEMFIMNPLSKFLKLGKIRTMERNTRAFIKAVERYPIWGITHPGDKIDVDITELAEACKKKGVKLEVNSSHGKLNKDDILEIKDYFSDFFVGSDAHSATRIGNFDNAEMILKDAGIEIGNLWNYKE